MRWFGAQGNNTGDDQPAFANAIECARAGLGQPGAQGGAEVFVPAGLYSVHSPVSLSGNDPAVAWNGSAGYPICSIALRGVRASIQSGYAFGSWLVWAGGAGSSAVLELKDIHDCVVEGLGISGGAPGINGISLSSDNDPNTQSLSLRDLTIYNCVQDSSGAGGIGIVWGDPNPTGMAFYPYDYQADLVIIEGFTMVSCATGIQVNSDNAADSSIISNGGLLNCQTCVNVVSGATFKITRCQAGTSLPGCTMFKVYGADSLVIEHCESEGHEYFLFVPPTYPEDAHVREETWIFKIRARHAPGSSHLPGRVQMRAAPGEPRSRPRWRWHPPSFSFAFAQGWRAPITRRPRPLPASRSRPTTEACVWTSRTTARPTARR